MLLKQWTKKYYNQFFVHCPVSDKLLLTEDNMIIFLTGYMVIKWLGLSLNYVIPSFLKGCQVFHKITTVTLQYDHNYYIITTLYYNYITFAIIRQIYVLTLKYIL